MALRTSIISKLEGFSLKKAGDLNTKIDPAIQARELRASKLSLRVRGGLETEQGIPPWIDVIARLEKVNGKLIEPEGLAIISRIGDIVTGRVREGDEDAVRAKVRSLKLGKGVRLHLKAGIADVGFPQVGNGHDPLPRELQGIDGQGVVVGVVDRGCDVRHRNFRRADGTTRLLSLWDQRGPEADGAPFGYGREFDQNALGAGRDLPYSVERGSHGTHVLDIAAGNGSGTGQPGMAPGADLVFVELAGDADEPGAFGNSRHLLEAVKYIFDKAMEGDKPKPAVVNLSLGGYGGPHDGTSLVEQAFEHLLAEEDNPGRAIVISAGNGRSLGIHTQGELQPGESATLSWQIVRGPDLPEECEIWYTGKGELKVSLTTPLGERLEPVPLGETADLLHDGSSVGHLIHRQNDPNNGDNQIDIRVPSEEGIWQIRLEVVGKKPVQYHAWIERDDQGQSRFLHDAQIDGTLSSICCGESVVAVAAYDPRTQTPTIASFSAAGPTRRGKQSAQGRQPHVSAPGVGIVAATALSPSALHELSGTSMAAPFVSGLVALMFQVAANAGCRLSPQDIKEALKQGARRDGRRGWDSSFGWGRIEVAATLAAVQRIATQACPPAPQPSLAVPGPVLPGGGQPAVTP